MDYATKRSTRYKTMTSQGVYAGQMFYLNKWNGRVMVYLRHADHVGKDAAKRIATDFLISEFEAYDISFVVVKDKPFGWFAAKFTSDIL